MSVFDISTGDDWYGLLVLGVNNSNEWSTLFFSISMVFIVNYMTFGLVMAIILDGFSAIVGMDED